MAAFPGVIAFIGLVALAYAQANDQRNQKEQINNALDRISQNEQYHARVSISVSYLIFLTFNVLIIINDMM